MDTSKATRRAPVAAKERTFLADAAHELRTPLHSANGFVEMVLDGFAGSLNERQREMLGYAHIAIGQLNTLVEEVLFLARVDRGELLPHLATVDPAAILTRALESVHDQMNEENITVTRTGDGLPATIQADGERLREGLAGLLRGGLVLLSAHGAMTIVSSATDKALTVAVTLHNVRLNATDLHHLFDRFAQPRPLGAERSAHLGLGLVIAQTTAGWHGGAARAEHAPDGSLILCYELPLNAS